MIGHGIDLATRQRLQLLFGVVQDFDQRGDAGLAAQLDGVGF